MQFCINLAQKKSPLRTLLCTLFQCEGIYSTPPSGLSTPLVKFWFLSLKWRPLFVASCTICVHSCSLEDIWGYKYKILLKGRANVGSYFFIASPFSLTSMHTVWLSFISPASSENANLFSSSFLSNRFSGLAPYTSS